MANSNIILVRCCQDSEAVEFLWNCFPPAPLSYDSPWLKREEERADSNSTGDPSPQAPKSTLIIFNLEAFL